MALLIGVLWLEEIVVDEDIDSKVRESPEQFRGELRTTVEARLKVATPEEHLVVLFILFDLCLQWLQLIEQKVETIFKRRPVV